jgi:uncharacterized FlgJ-related protein
MELEFTSRFIKLRFKIRNQRSIKDTDKVMETLRSTLNMFELHKVLDLKYRVIDDTYRIRYSNKPEMRIIFRIMEVDSQPLEKKSGEKSYEWKNFQRVNVQTENIKEDQSEKQKKKQILELLWIGSREEYEKYAHNAIREDVENKLSITITEEQYKKLNQLLQEDIEDLDVEMMGTPNDTNFSRENFAKVVKSVGIKNPDIAVAQSLLETGHFTSPVFKKNNNLFGMKHPSKRDTVSKGTKNGHAYYDSWQDSVKDYRLWQQKLGFDELPRDEYFKKLDTVYCPPPHCSSKEYSRNVKSLLPKANDILGNKYIIKKITTTKTKKPIKKIIKSLNEYSYMGKYEGDKIKVGEFSKRKMPRPIEKNVLRAISNVLESDVKQSKLRKGEYDDVEIRLFGQLLSFLSGTY